MSESRNITNANGDIIGELTLPDDTPEDIWTEKLAIYSFTPAAPVIATVIKNKILAAMDFGKNLMAEYGAQNILAGLDMAQIQTVMEKTQKVQAALATGSLYVALTELDNIVVDDVVITQGRLDSARHKIQDFLGIPQT